MAHNFKQVGDYYVSIFGSDAQSGLTPDLPKRTLQAGLNLLTATGKILVVGAGVYKETIARHPAAAISSQVIADGKVVLDGNNNTYSFLYGGTSSANIWTVNFTGFEFRNFLNISALAGNTSGSVATFDQCEFKSLNFTKALGTGTASTIAFINCKFINCTRSAGTGAIALTATFDKCILINTNFGTAGSGQWTQSTFVNSYVDISSIIRSNSASAFNYNNVEGGLTSEVATAITTGTYQDWIGQYYDLSVAGSGGAGTIGSPYQRGNTAGAVFLLSVFKVLFPLSHVNSFSADPEFNYVANLNFTLQLTSPHIKRASDGTNIGGTEYAQRMPSTHGYVSLTDLIFSGSDLVVDPSAAYGEAVYDPFFIQWPLVRPLDKIIYEGLLAFNKAETAGGSQNLNVPDTQTYASGAGASPDRLSIQFRFSTQEVEPTTSGEWDNGGYVTAGDYVDYEIDSKPQIDVTGKGNGDPAYIGSGTIFDIICSWVQVKIILRRTDYV